MAKRVTTVAVAVAELVRATRRLTEPQGRIARRNARARVAITARKLLQLIDQEFPLNAAPVERKARRKRKSRALTWHHILRGEAAELLRQGLSRHRVWRNPKSESEQLYVEPWIAEALKRKISAKTIVAASKNPRKRRALETFFRLGGGA